DPVQKSNLASVEKAVELSFREAREAILAVQEGEPLARMVYPPRLLRSMRITGAAFANLLQAEARRQVELPLSSKQAQMFLVVFVLFGVVMNIIIAVVLMDFFGRGITRRLALIVDNIQNMKEGKELVQPSQGDDDEIALLEREFHDMAVIVSEGRKKEQALVGNVRSVISSLDRNLTFTKVSDEAGRTWGEREYLGTNLRELCLEDEFAEISRRFESYSQSKELSGEFDIRIVRLSGAPLWMHWSVFWSREQESFYCVANDITQQKEVQEMKRDFTQMLSHDLRSPLQSVLAFIEVLECGYYGILNERGVSKVPALRRTVDHLVRLINNLLDLEKMDAGKLELRCEPANLKELIDMSFEYISELAERRQLQFKSEIDQHINVVVDRDKITQVFQNLLGNAVKFAPVGSAIEVRSRLRGNYIETDIVDYGQGIPLDQQEKIFDRFHQVKDEDGKRTAGTGLGLAFCKQILDLHGGQIGVESKEGHGSTFWLILPVYQLPGTANTQRLINRS
ncbi:MAG: HAMP domain-containing histidine kinase, partial [Cyanobacteria bacterium]|nr:HAMP domain-containing histidine kinase [Cyanobacteriota bacterium]